MSCIRYLVITLFLFTTQAEAQTPFINPTGSYVLDMKNLTDSLNTYTRIDIKWISGTRVALMMYINTQYGMTLRPMSLIDEDNMIVYRTADDYPHCNTVFYISADSLKVLDLKPDAHSPCVRHGGMWGSGSYRKTSAIEPKIGGLLYTH